MKKLGLIVSVIVLVTALTLVAACGTVVTPPVLTIGAIFPGSRSDYGYNQALYESVMAIKANIPGVEILWADMVGTGADAVNAMESQLAHNATLMIVTGNNNQDAAWNLSQTHPSVKFEFAGGWLNSSNFDTFYGDPPNPWYLMGMAAGMVTNTSKLGFVLNFPFGWAVVGVNMFTLGAQSVNPAVNVTVVYTHSWIPNPGVEAGAVDALVVEGCDVIANWIDAPQTVISRAEYRHVYSVGWQSLACQAFAPNYWLVGSGFTLGGMLTQFAQQVINGTWTSQKLRWGLKEGGVTMSWGTVANQTVRDAVAAEEAHLATHWRFVFPTDVRAQNGTIMYTANTTLPFDYILSAWNWFVQNVTGDPGSW